MELTTISATVYTAEDGTYSIMAPPNVDLQFSIIGYKPMIVKAPDNGILDITLYNEIELGQVVVTALGIEREQDALAGINGMALWHTRQNQDDTALSFLEKALVHFYPFETNILEEPAFSKIRTTERFARLMQQYFPK